MVSDDRFGFLAFICGVFIGSEFFGRESGEGFTGFEGFAVLRSEAVFIDGFDVRFGAVADVFVESVFGVLGGELDHVVISCDFGDDGSG